MRFIAVVTLALLATQPARLTYPPSAKADVADDYHGTRVADPYRWMEDLESPDVARWIKAQNDVTFGYLEGLPMREHFKRRITELWNYPKTGVPVREGGRLFYTRNTGLQKQAPVYVRETLTSAPRVLLDPNVLSQDGSLSLSQWKPSPDGRLFAYTLSEGGADWRTIHVRDIQQNRDLRIGSSGCGFQPSRGRGTAAASSIRATRSPLPAKSWKRRFRDRPSTTTAWARRSRKTG